MVPCWYDRGQNVLPRCTIKLVPRRASWGRFEVLPLGTATETRLAAILSSSGSAARAGQVRERLTTEISDGHDKYALKCLSVNTSNTYVYKKLNETHNQ